MQISASHTDAANVEFIQFWLMDPFNTDYENEYGTGNDGTLYFNIGNLSEDVLKDSKKTFENKLPTTEAESQILTGDNFSAWGRVTPEQSVVNAFDNNPETRPFQDIGLDGLRNVEELTYFADYLEKIENDPTLGTGSAAYTIAQNDPSTDDYNYFRDDDYDADQVRILDRYKLQRFGR